MPTNSFTINSDANVQNPPLSYASDAWIGTGFGLTSDATIVGLATIYQLPYKSDAYIVAIVPIGPGKSLIPTNLCAIASPCVDPATPFANFSAELPDSPLYLGYYSGPLIPPPLGNEFTSTGCVGTCVTTTTQDDADLCAQSQQVNCQVTDPNKGGTTGGGLKTPSGGPVAVYTNRPVSCTGGICPDGLPFTYTVPAGKVLALSQSQADAEALAFACRAARTHLVCLSSVTPDTPCVGSNFSGTITASGNEVDQFFGNNNWQLVAGVFPPGLNFPSGYGGPSIEITGTPTQGGSFTFTIRMTAPSGDYMQKQYTICVIGITPGSAPADTLELPDGATGSAYSQQLVANSCATPALSWQIIGGALPPGLTLDEQTGIISGTPTTGGKFSFSVTLQTQAT